MSGMRSAVRAEEAGMKTKPTMDLAERPIPESGIIESLWSCFPSNEYMGPHIGSLDSYYAFAPEGSTVRITLIGRLKDIGKMRAERRSLERDCAERGIRLLFRQYRHRKGLYHFGKGR